MMKLLRVVGLLSLAGCAMIFTCQVDARDLDSATSLYSQGVHAYFAGRTAEAELLLSRALEINDQDPRIYYFRALNRLWLGRDGDARRDMAAGAAREATRQNRYAVGAALQRVQGSHRLLLEQYRRDARSKAATASTQRARQQAEQMTARDAGALRERVVIPLDELLRSGKPEALSAEEIARRAVVFQPTRLAPAGPVEVPPATLPVDAENDPFRDDASPPARAPVPPSSPASSPMPEAPSSVDEADDNPFDF